MRKILLLVLGSLITPAFSLAQDDVKTLREVVVSARRPMKDIGVQKTQLDSARLKENISLSMADVLTFNSSVFVKSAGRATLSTVAFRGTSPSHTQVTWNGMRVNSPMLGMTDFSTIPAFFIDGASLLHGSSSVARTGGGLGGLVSLSTAPSRSKGVSLHYVQGVGSFSTFDEFLRLDWGSDKWSTSTRVSLSTSPNDYTYINRDKKENIYGYDEEGNRVIVGQYHPKEKNRSASFRDFNLLQEVYFTPSSADRLGLSGWFTSSNRELPMLSTDYGDERGYENRQRENTFRGVVSWRHRSSGLSTDLRGGYTHTWMGYDYRREAAADIWSVLTRSRSRVNTFFLEGSADWQPRPDLYVSASVSAHENMVRSRDGVAVSGEASPLEFSRSRLETSASASLRWQPSWRWGFAAVVREESAGESWSAPVPALFADVVLYSPARVMLKCSASRNQKFPTLNDLYFLPGGNPDLRPERGWSYDAGASFQIEGGRLASGSYSLCGSATWFDSRIDDWIIWLPTVKGFFTPRNVKTVHAYGVESRLGWQWDFARGWELGADASYTWSPSVNVGKKMSDADMSVGRQLPYVPRHSASASCRLRWGGWGFLYKWMCYSERYTMSSNEHTLTGSLPAYTVSNVSLERRLSFSWSDLDLKLAVNNIFDSEYLSVLSRPMPGINFEFFISISPRF